MPGDPNELMWFEFFTALLVANEPAEARLKADRALATHIERWPREREVVTKQQNERELRDTAHSLIGWIGEHICQEVRSAQRNLDYHRRDASMCLDEVVDAIRSGLIRFDDGDSRAGVPFMRIAMPDLDDGSAEAIMNELRTMLGLSLNTMPRAVRDHVENRIAEGEKRGRMQGIRDFAANLGVDVSKHCPSGPPVRSDRESVIMTATCTCGREFAVGSKDDNDATASLQRMMLAHLLEARTKS